MLVRDFALKPATGPITESSAINPDTMKYKRPDFGFNDFLTFDEESNEDNLWSRLIDCVKNNPEQERLQIYIRLMQQHTRHAKAPDIGKPEVSADPDVSRQKT